MIVRNGNYPDGEDPPKLSTIYPDADNGCESNDNGCESNDYDLEDCEFINRLTYNHEYDTVISFNGYPHLEITHCGYIYNLFTINTEGRSHLNQDHSDAIKSIAMVDDLLTLYNFWTSMVAEGRIESKYGELVSIDNR